jgi:hypothetical protein
MGDTKQVEPDWERLVRDIRELRLSQLYTDRDVSDLSIKLEGVEDRLTTKIDGAEQRLSTKIDSVEKRIDSSYEDLVRQINKRFDFLGEAIQIVISQTKKE